MKNVPPVSAGLLDDERALQEKKLGLPTRSPTKIESLGGSLAASPMHSLQKSDELSQLSVTVKKGEAEVLLDAVEVARVGAGAAGGLDLEVGDAGRGGGVAGAAEVGDRAGG